MRVARISALIAQSALAVLLFLAPALAEKRVALVIGNGAYKNTSKLPNPINDAKAIAGMLQSAGFDAVELQENLGIRELRRAIGEFSDMARDADTAIVYYSGHGIEVNGINYLIPVDAVLDRDSDVPFEAYSLDNLLQVLEPVRRMRLIMLDACRDNPFARSMKRTVGTRAVGRGLAVMEPTSVNTLIGFAAKAGSTASDGDGANSPYAIAVLNNLPTPGLDLRIAFGRVRDEVLKSTKNKQEPFTYGSLGGGNFSIVKAPSSEQQIENSLWESVKDSKRPETLQTYLNFFPNGRFANLARQMITQLSAEAAARAEAATRAEAAVRAEAAARAEAVARAEAAAKAEVAAKAKAEQSKPAAEATTRGDQSKYAALERRDTLSSGTTLDKAEAERTGRLINRGEQLMIDGNVAAARESFKIAAEAGNAEAALAMGSTYDPNHFSKYNIRGMRPDKAIAQLWYRRAIDLGSKEALDRLELLDKL